MSNMPKIPEAVIDQQLLHDLRVLLGSVTQKMSELKARNIDVQFGVDTTTNDVKLVNLKAAKVVNFPVD